MPEIYGFTVGGRDYQYDFGSLANKPNETKYLPNLDDGPYPAVVVHAGGNDIHWTHYVEIPVPNNDEGKVLSVTQNDEVEWIAPAGDELPQYGVADSGKVLTVSRGATPALVWETPDSGDTIPGCYAEDVGKVLTVTGSGEFGWETVEGGTGIPEYGSNEDGYVLTVVNGGYDIAWEVPTGGGGGDNIPQCNYSDVGKALVVTSSDEYDWEFVIPECGGDGDVGKVLTVTGSDGAFDWEFVSGAAIPECSGGDVGKVLTVTACNEYDWQDIGEISGGIPEYDGSDSNKILAVNNTGDALVWVESSASQIPTITQNDYGKVLTVNASVQEMLWEDIPSELPPYDEVSDVGKVLMIGDDGVLTWETPA